MHAIHSMLPLSLLVISAFLSIVFAAAAHDAVCDEFYGRPSFSACSALIQRFRDNTREHFFGILPTVQGPKPPDVSAAAWATRHSLPWVRSVANCNLGLLSVYKVDGIWPITVATGSDLVSLEGPRGIIGDCVYGRGVGGFRQTRTLSSLLPCLQMSQLGANNGD